MRIIYYKKQIFDFISRNKTTLILLLFCLVAGTATGTIFSVTASGDGTDNLREYINNFVSVYSLQRVEPASVVKYSMLNNGKTVVLLYLSCIWRGFVPVPFLQTIYLGFRFGFATASIIKLFGAEGIPFALLCSIPQILIFAPFFVLYCVYNVRFTLSGRSSSNHKLKESVKNIFYLKNILFLVVLTLVVLLTALFDGYVIPLVLKPVCAILGKR